MDEDDKSLQQPYLAAEVPGQPPHAATVDAPDNNLQLDYTGQARGITKTPETAEAVAAMPSTASSKASSAALPYPHCSLMDLQLKQHVARQTFLAMYARHPNS